MKTIITLFILFLCVNYLFFTSTGIAKDVYLSALIIITFIICVANEIKDAINKKD